MDVFRGYADTAVGQIHYRMWGAGPALILLHGAAESSRAFSDVAPVLARDFQVIAIDLPGHGDSDPAPAETPLDTYARITGEVMDVLGITSAGFLGCGVGAAVGLKLVAVDPARVDALVLSDLPDRALPTGDPAELTVSGEHMDAAWRRAMTAMPGASTQQLHRATIDVLKAGVGAWTAECAARAEDLEALLATTPVPSLTLAGAPDPAAVSRFLARQNAPTRPTARTAT